MTATIELIERRQGCTGREGWYARIRLHAIRLHNGKREPNYDQVAELSKMDDESKWTFDSLFSHKGVPLFVHGFGTRICATSQAFGDLADLLDGSLAVAAGECPCAQCEVV